MGWFSKALGSITGANKAEKSANNAIAAQTKQADNALAAQREMFDLSRQDLSPYMDTGRNALMQLDYLTTGRAPEMSYQDQMELERLMSMTGQLSPQDQQKLQYLQSQQKQFQGFTPTSFQSSPMYDLQMDDFTRNMNAQLAARGGFNSRGGLNALSDGFRRIGAEEQERQYGRLAGLANYGMGTANQAAQGALQSGNAQAGIYQNKGNAMAQGNYAKGQLYTTYSPLNVGMSIASTASKFVPFGGGGQ